MHRSKKGMILILLAVFLPAVVMAGDVQSLARSREAGKTHQT
jgi:hypothetical protein